MATGTPTLFEDAGFGAGRIQPVNYTPADGDWAFVIGSDLEGRIREVEIGDASGLEQDVDLTSITSITFAVALRQTEGSSAAVRRGTDVTYPKAFVTGDTFKLKVDGGGEQTITFVDTDTTLANIVDRANATLSGAVASANNNQLEITSSSTGTGSSIEITGGTVYTDLGHTLGATAGEYVTFRLVFEIDGVEHFTLQPAAGENPDYTQRTVNTQRLAGTCTLRWYLEAVAS